MQLSVFFLSWRSEHSMSETLQSINDETNCFWAKFLNSSLKLAIFIEVPLYVGNLQ